MICLNQAMAIVLSVDENGMSDLNVLTFGEYIYFVKSYSWRIYVFTPLT